MTTANGAKQRDARALTGGAKTFNGDLLDMYNDYLGDSGPFDKQEMRWLSAHLGGASGTHAGLCAKYAQSRGTNWGSMPGFNPICHANFDWADFDRIVGSSTFTRATAGNYFDANGVMQSATTGNTRIGYDGDRNLKGYIVEPTVINICPNPRAFDSWNVNSSATTAANQKGIDGVANAAFTVTDANAAGYASINESVTVTANTTNYIASVKVLYEDDETVFPEVQFAIGGVTNYLLTINKKTGAATKRGGVGSHYVDSVTDADGRKWWNVVISIANNLGTAMTLTILPAVSTVWGSAETAAQGSVVVDAAMIERDKQHAGIFEDGTKNADELQIGTTGNTVTNDFVWYLEYTPLGQHGTFILMESYVDAGNLTALYHDGTNLIMRKKVSATDRDGQYSSFSYTRGTTHKIAGRVSSTNGVAVFADGTKGGTENANTDAAQIGATLEIGYRDTGNTLHASGYIKNVQIIHRDMTDAELVALTT
jgi:hypothetical protein